MRNKDNNEPEGYPSVGSGPGTDPGKPNNMQFNYGKLQVLHYRNGTRVGTRH